MSMSIGNFISKYIPFSYLWVFKVAIGNNVKTVLDLGCGDGRFMHDLARNENWQLTGVELFNKSIKKAKTYGLYKKIYQGDVIKICKHMVKKGEQYDLVISSHVIEHLEEKKGELLINYIEQLAVKRAVIATPNNFMDQIEESLGENPYQVHKSGWGVGDFEKFGFEVYGVGFNPIWSDKGLARVNSPQSLVFKIMSLVLAPVVFSYPNLGSGLVAFKIYEKR